MNRISPHWLRAFLAFIVALALPLSSLFAAGEEEGEVPEGYAQLVVITTFDAAEITVNGVAYPYEWINNEMDGVLLPANRTYNIVVTGAPETQRSFRLELEDGETRVLVVNPPGVARRAPERPERPRVRATDEDEEENEEEDGEEEEVGYLGVSSSPRGIVHVDGESTGSRTPARRIQLEPGRHEVTVFYDEQEQMSEVKHVLIRPGVNTNVFFRLRRERQRDQDED